MITGIGPQVDAIARHNAAPVQQTKARMNDQNPHSQASRVLLAHRFFAPDVTTYAQMLEVLGRTLAGAGYDVSVFSTQPSYNGVYDGEALPRRSCESGVDVHRLTIPGAGTSIGRLLGGVLYGIALVLHCARPGRRYDVVSVSTVPPVLMGIFGSVAARLAGAKLIYHCMDLYPEIAIASHLASPGLRTRAAAKLDGITLRSAAAVVVLSQDMRQTLLDRGHEGNNIKILNNFVLADAEARADLPVEWAQPEGRLRFIFAGNLGRFQGLETLVEGFAKAQCAHPELQLCFMGAGVAEPRLREMADRLAGDAVVFIPHQPLPVAMAAIEGAEAAAISLSPGLIASAYPSKTMMYLEMGTPVLAVVESDSELADLVNGRQLGVTATPGDVESIAAAFGAIATDPPTSEDRRRCRTIAAEVFGQDAVMALWRKLYTDLCDSEERARCT